MTRVSAQLEAVFLASRPKLLAFLRSRNAGDAAEDILQEIWMRLPREGAEVDVPLSYLYRMANSLVIDRYRGHGRAARRETDWNDVVGPAFPGISDEPDADRIVTARDLATRVMTVIEQEGERVAYILRRHRIDGLTQRQVADELGVSVGTVEGDLRKATRALIAFRTNNVEE